MAKFSKDKDKFLIDKIYYALGYPFKKVYTGIKKTSEKIRKKYFEKNPEAKVKHEERRERLAEKGRRLYHGFVEKDKQIAARMIHAINHIDKKNDAFAEKAAGVAANGGEKLNLAREWAELNKKKLLIRFGCVVIVVFCIVNAVNACIAYEYSYNGRTLGIVKDQEDVYRIVDLVSEKLSKEHGAEIVIDKEEDISFKRVFAIGKDIDDMELVLTRMTYMQDMVADGVGIYIDGKRVAIVDNEDTAQYILDSVLAAFTVQNENTKYEEIGFAEEVTTETVKTKLGRLENPGDVIRKILTGAEEIKTHFVQPGETFSEIAKTYGISMADLQAANPLVTPAKLSIGQEIVLTQAVPMLTVQTVEISTLIEYTPYNVIYEENAAIYQGETSTKVKGVPGEREVVAKIVKNNGVEIARLELQSKTLKDPVTEVIIIGTKALPPKQGTGTFIYPVTGAKLTSTFGSRWGSTHTGVDLACPTGTKIRASDGGTVTFAGYSGSYGYLVKIDHGGGYETYYAHCSKLLVKAGEKVYQGQHIANVGSTGRSTGPHVHFEVRYLGVPKNPFNYI